jgi:hypothetical protein
MTESAFLDNARTIKYRVEETWDDQGKGGVIYKLILKTQFHYP